MGSASDGALLPVVGIFGAFDEKGRYQQRARCPNKTMSTRRVLACGSRAIPSLLFINPSTLRNKQDFEESCACHSLGRHDLLASALRITSMCCITLFSQIQWIKPIKLVSRTGQTSWSNIAVRLADVSLVLSVKIATNWRLAWNRGCKTWVFMRHIRFTKSIEAQEA